MLLGTLGARLLGNLLKGKEIARPGSENKKGKGIVRAGSGCPLQKNCIFNAALFFNKFWNTKIL